LLTAIGLGAVAAAVFLSMEFVNAKPLLLTPPDEARSKVIMLMDAVAEGDYEEASQSIYGTPDLGVGREAADHVGILIWDAFEGSVTYELLGECYTTDQGLAQDVTITCLDIASVTTNLKERSQTLLEQRVAEAADVSEIYDENNDYREDFVMQVLYDSTVDALAQDARTTTKQVTLSLVYDDGQWWVMPESQLLDAISGGLLK
jgi:hypothetical protein